MTTRPPQSCSQIHLRVFDAPLIFFTFSQRKRIGAGAFLQRKHIGHYLAEDHGSSHLDNG